MGGLSPQHPPLNTPSTLLLCTLYSVHQLSSLETVKPSFGGVSFKLLFIEVSVSILNLIFVKFYPAVQMYRNSWDNQFQLLYIEVSVVCSQLYGRVTMQYLCISPGYH